MSRRCVAALLCAEEFHRGETKSGADSARISRRGFGDGEPLFAFFSPPRGCGNTRIETMLTAGLAAARSAIYSISQRFFNSMLPCLATEKLRLLMLIASGTLGASPFLAQLHSYLTEL